MEYWQGVLIAVAAVGVFFGVFAGIAFLRRNRGSQADEWHDEMAMRASEFVHRHGGP